MKIRFLKPWTVKQGDNQGPKYEVGQMVDFAGAIAETYARKYIARGLAEEVVAEKGARALVAPGQPQMINKGFGKYDVLDAEGKPVNDKPLPKAEAEALLASLQKPAEQ